MNPESVPEPRITGRTRLYGIVAHPVHHVKGPEVMHRLFRALGVDGVLVPFDVRPARLAGWIDGMRAVENWGGAIVTVPHKPAMLDLCDRVTDQARLVEAVNCVRRDADGRILGAMLDGIGFIKGLGSAGIDPRGMRAVVAGAGGAASAIAFALAEKGVHRLTVLNRTEARARDLIARVAAAYPGVDVSIDADDVGAADLIINATSLGMRPGDASPVDTDRLQPRQIVAEAIMEPARTALVERAQAIGCRIQPGLPMLESQIRLMAEHMGAL